MNRLSRTQNRNRFQRGFTLMELLVVLAILGLLMGLVGPQVLNQLGGAKTKTAALQIADLEQTLEMYKQVQGTIETIQKENKTLDKELEEQYKCVKEFVQLLPLRIAQIKA